MHMNVTNPAFEGSTIGLHMQALGYSTGMFGKLLNPSGVAPYCNQSAPQPLPGFDDYLAMCNDNRYFKNRFTFNGQIFTTGTAPEDYLTSVIGNKTLDFVKGALEEDKPFFAYVAPHAPHVPATPAPWYASEFSGMKAPRTPNYNYSAGDHHYVVRSQGPLTADQEAEVDELFENRWRTLLSVDDIARTLVSVLEEYKQMNNTFIVHTSDHGFQLGQFRLPSCKLQPYEHDLRVPFSVRGPGIPAGFVFDFMAGMVDVAPTLLSLVGGSPPAFMDGKSFAEPLLKPSQTGVRDKHMIEYWTLGDVVRYKHYIDMPNNTFIGVRLLNSTHNYMYAEFYEGDVDDFDTPLEYELYNVAADPYQMVNLYGTAGEDRQMVAELQQFIHTEVKCNGQPNCQ
jgi:N-acetylglucosamine-6-sulfatase